LIFGIGLGIGGIVYGFNALGTWTPWILVVAGVVLGILLALVPRPWGRSVPPAEAPA
jgi:hypothetical protein